MFGTQTMVVRGEGDDNDFWVVQWQGVKRERLLLKVRAGVQRWIDRGHGKVDDYFNIADLKALLTDESLIAALEYEGVCDLTLDKYDAHTPHEGWFNYTRLLPEEKH